MYGLHYTTGTGTDNAGVRKGLAVDCSLQSSGRPGGQRDLADSREINIMAGRIEVLSMMQKLWLPQELKVLSPDAWLDTVELPMASA